MAACAFVPCPMDLQEPSPTSSPMVRKTRCQDTFFGSYSVMVPTGKLNINDHSLYGDNPVWGFCPAVFGHLNLCRGDLLWFTAAGTGQVQACGRVETWFYDHERKVKSALWKESAVESADGYSPNKDWVFIVHLSSVMRFETPLDKAVVCDWFNLNPRGLLHARRSNLPSRMGVPNDWKDVMESVVDSEQPAKKRRRTSR